MLDRRAIRRLMREKQRRRAGAIRKLHRVGVREGGPDDPGYWALVHDLEFAPLTTNLDQLREIGVEMPDPLVLDATELATTLDEVIRGLATIDVFLLHTGHLDDRSLYVLLRDRILREQVRDVPSGCGSREWIDIAGGTDRETFLAWYADEDERAAARNEGEIVPERRPWRSDRDERLPRPMDAMGPRDQERSMR
jgi:hypothetical protein